MLEGLFNFNITRICINGDREFLDRCEPVADEISSKMWWAPTLLFGAVAAIFLQKCVYAGVEAKKRYRKQDYLQLRSLNGEESEFPVIRPAKPPLSVNRCMDNVFLPTIVALFFAALGIGAKMAEMFVRNEVCNGANEALQLICTGEINAVKHELIG